MNAPEHLPIDPRAHAARVVEALLAVLPAHAV